MEDRLKERLTGAVILILIVVILVPAMFRGEKQPLAATPGTGTAGARVQSYTIDLAGGAASVPAPVSSPAPVLLAPPATAAGVAPVPPAVASVAGSAAPAIAPPASMPKPEPKAESKVAAKAELKPAARPASRPQAAPADSGPDGYVVQVGSFSRRDNAVTMIKQAAHKGLRLAVAGPDERGLFRVRSAVVRTHQEAMALQSRLKNAGFKGLVSAAN